MKCVRERRVRVPKDIVVIIGIWTRYVREVPHHVAVDSEREVRDGGDLPKVVRRDEEDGYCGAYGGRSVNRRQHKRRGRLQLTSKSDCDRTLVYMAFRMSSIVPSSVECQRDIWLR